MAAKKRVERKKLGETSDEGTAKSRVITMTVICSKVVDEIAPATGETHYSASCNSQLIASADEEFAALILSNMRSPFFKANERYRVTVERESDFLERAAIEKSAVEKTAAAAAAAAAAEAEARKTETDRKG